MSGVARTNRTGGTAQVTRQQLDELDALLKRMLDLPVSKNDDDFVEEEEAPAPRVEARPAPTSPGRAYPPSYVVVESPTIPGLEPRESHDESELDPRPIEQSRDLREKLIPFIPEEDSSAQASPSSPRSNVEREDWVPLRSSWQPSAQTWKPLAETWESSRAIPTPSEPPMATRIPPMTNQPPVPPMAVPLAMPAVSPSVPVVPTNVPTMVIPPPPATYGPPPSPTVPTVPQPINAEPSTPWILLPAVWFNQAFDACLFPLGPIGTWLKGRAGRGFLGTVGILAILAAAALAAADNAGLVR